MLAPNKAKNRFHQAFAMMFIIPVLIFFYILTVELYNIGIFIGTVGLLVSLAIIIGLLGYFFSFDILKGLFRAVKSLQKMDKSRSQFVASISHDLKNPLTTINGHIDGLLAGIHGDISEKQKKVLHTCLDVVERMNRLNANLFEMHMYELDNTGLKRKYCDVIAILQRLVEQLRPEIINKKLVLNERYLDRDAHLWADYDKINRALSNLLDNAVKYTPNYGTIEIDVSRKGRFVKISFHNTGISLPEDQLEEVFNRYKRHDITTKGSGLGLAIVKDIIELHHGSVWAESNPKGGNRFTVLLPSDLRA